MRELTTKSLAIVLSTLLISCSSQNSSSSKPGTMGTGSTLKERSLKIENDLQPNRTIATQAEVNTAKPYAPFDWPSRPPADSPFEPSKDIVGITFTGRHREYAHADCWFPDLQHRVRILVSWRIMDVFVRVRVDATRPAPG